MGPGGSLVLSHPLLEALLSAGRQSASASDFALVRLLCLLGRR